MRGPDQLREEAAKLRAMGELPDNRAIRQRLLDLAQKYEEMAAERENSRNYGD